MPWQNALVTSSLTSSVASAISSSSRRAVHRVVSACRACVGAEGLMASSTSMLSIIDPPSVGAELRWPVVPRGMPQEHLAVGHLVGDRAEGAELSGFLAGGGSGRWWPSMPPWEKDRGSAAPFTPTTGAAVPRAYDVSPSAMSASPKRARGTLTVAGGARAQGGMHRRSGAPACDRAQPPDDQNWWPRLLAALVHATGLIISDCRAWCADQ